jgi:hypothetical protein
MSYYCIKCQVATNNPKYCSRSCASSSNNAKRIRSEESKAKTSATLSSYIEANADKVTARCTLNGLNQKGKRWAKQPDESWTSYRKAANFYTPHYLLQHIEGHELISQIGWYHNKHNKTGASRDHMYSAKEGWLNNVPIEIIKHPANCRIIPILENKAKGKKCSISLEELYDRISKWRA